MKIYIYANCQGIGIKEFLKAKINNSQITNILNYEKLRTKESLNYDEISKCDIFIYQHVSASHGIYSTDINVSNSITNYLREGCTKIAVPFVYNSSLWSMFEEGDDIINKEAILNLKANGFSLDKIFKSYDNFDLDFKYVFRDMYCRNTLVEKEKNCDIKIANFIEEEITNLKLFLTQNHPTSAIFVNIVNQILKLVGIQGNLNYKEFDENYSQLPGIYKHNKYDLQYWNFKFPVERDGDEWTKELIKKVYGS